jgi:hypothetical protein
MLGRHHPGIIPGGYWVCGVGMLLAIPQAGENWTAMSAKGSSTIANRSGIWMFV